jgi:hypothetical protein
LTPASSAVVGLKVTISTSNSGVTITDGTAVATPPKPS